MNLNLYEMMYMSRMGDQYAQEALFSFFRSVTYRLAGEYIPKGSFLETYRDDIVQETMSSLFDIIDCYRFDRGASALTFIILALRRRLLSALRKYSTPNYQQRPEMFTAPDDDERYWIRVSSPKGIYDPEYSLAYAEAARRLNSVYSRMNETDKEFVRSWYRGESQEALAQRLGTTRRSVNSHMHKVKQQVRCAVYSRQYKDCR